MCALTKDVCADIVENPIEAIAQAINDFGGDGLLFHFVVTTAESHLESMSS